MKALISVLKKSSFFFTGYILNLLKKGTDIRKKSQTQPQIFRHQWVTIKSSFEGSTGHFCLNLSGNVPFFTILQSCQHVNWALPFSYENYPLRRDRQSPDNDKAKQKLTTKKWDLIGYHFSLSIFVTTRKYVSNGMKTNECRGMLGRERALARRTTQYSF